MKRKILRKKLFWNKRVQHLCCLYSWNCQSKVARDQRMVRIMWPTLLYACPLELSSAGLIKMSITFQKMEWVGHVDVCIDGVELTVCLGCRMNLCARCYCLFHTKPDIVSMKTNLCEKMKKTWNNQVCSDWRVLSCNVCIVQFAQTIILVNYV